MKLGYLSVAGVMALEAVEMHRKAGLRAMDVDLGLLDARQFQMRALSREVDKLHRGWRWQDKVSALGVVLILVSLRMETTASRWITASVVGLVCLIGVVTLAWRQHLRKRLNRQIDVLDLMARP